MDSEELYNFHKTLYSKGVFNAMYPKTLLKQDYNWQDEFFKTGVIQDYYISVKGGSEKVGYYASLNYYDEEGTLITTGMNKFSANLNMNAQITKWLDMKARVNFSKSSVDYPSSWTMLDDAFNKMPWDNPYELDADGNSTGNYLYVGSNTRADNGQKWWSQNTWNALHSAQYNYSRSNNFDFNGMLQLNVHFTDWLSFSTTNTFSTGYYKSKSYVDPKAYDSSYTNGYLEESIGLSRSFGTTNLLKASYQWGDHSVNGMLGWEWGTWKSEYTTASGTGMPAGVDALNATSPFAISGDEIPGASWAGFIQAQYDYAKRYFVTAKIGRAHV